MKNLGDIKGIDQIDEILDEVFAERYKQLEKWGVQNHGVADWMLILSEEFGEAAKDANEIRFRGADVASYRKELIQTAAVCVAAIEALDRGFK